MAQLALKCLELLTSECTPYIQAFEAGQHQAWGHNLVLHGNIKPLSLKMTLRKIIRHIKEYMYSENVLVVEFQEDVRTLGM